MFLIFFCLVESPLLIYCSLLILFYASILVAFMPSMLKKQSIYAQVSFCKVYYCIDFGKKNLVRVSMFLYNWLKHIRASRHRSYHVLSFMQMLHMSTCPFKNIHECLPFLSLEIHLILNLFPNWSTEQWTWTVQQPHYNLWYLNT